jgi:hypothetical protein
MLFVLCLSSENCIEKGGEIILLIQNFVAVRQKRVISRYTWLGQVAYFAAMQLSNGLAQQLATVSHVPPAGPIAVGSDNYPVEMQDMSNWCWAASASALSNFYSPSGQSMQRQIVAGVLQLPACGGSELSAACNETADFTDVLNFVSHLQSPALDSILDRESLISQLSTNNPVGCQMNIPGIGGHIVVVVGATQDSAGNLFVTVADPADGTLPVMTFDQLRTNYRGNGGQWVRTYMTH